MLDAADQAARMVNDLICARGETEETIRRLSANFRTERLTAEDYWPVQNLLVVFAKTLTALLRR